LVPLTLTDDNNARIISLSIAVVTITSLVLSLTLLPPLLLWDVEKRNKIYTKTPPVLLRNLFQKAPRVMYKFLAGVVRMCVNFPAAVLAAGFLFLVSAVLLLCVKGVDTSAYGSEDSLYAQVEFDGGLLAQEADRLLAGFSEQLLKIDGIKNVQTGARKSSGTVLISIDLRKTNTRIIRDAVKEINIPGGFVFFHEDSSEDRYWEIFIYGDEDQKCRELARELAFVFTGHPLIKEKVLNFKDGSNMLVLLPDREILAGTNISFFNAASSVRMGVYGPVAYKRLEADGEIDVRIRTGENVTRQSKENVLNLLVASGSEEAFSSLKIESLVSLREEKEPSSIKRDNRRRTASIIVSTKPMDARKVKKELIGLFEKIDLPPGYSIEFDPQAIRQSENLSAAVFSLIMALIFCYMIMACINESFIVPLLALSAAAPSLALPAIFLVLSGSAYNSAVACAFIVVSGMTVNASILCVDGFRFRMKTGKIKSPLLIYRVLREKMPALLSTTGTTVAGAIPFIFLTEGANTLIKTLSLVGALGVACSFFCSITVIPSLISIFKFSELRINQN